VLKLSAIQIHVYFTLLYLINSKVTLKEYTHDTNTYTVYEFVTVNHNQTIDVLVKSKLVL